MCGCFSSESDPHSQAADAGADCDADSASCPLLGKLRVALIDDEDGSGISGVDITITGPDGSTQPTGSDGKVVFTSLHPGGYTAQHGSACVSAASGSATVSAGATADIELRVRHTHAAITIKSLEYSAHNVVEKDTTGNFTAPEWLKGRAPADQSPVAYARKKNVAFKATFEVTTKPCRPETVAVRGAAAFGPANLEWEGNVSVGPGDAEVTLSLTSKQPLADEVGFFDASDIGWEMNPAARGWAPAGTSRHTLYVTLGNPSGSPNYWTLLDISCRAAAGKKTEDDFVKASFTPYAGKLGTGNGFKRLRDGQELTYYKMGGSTPSAGVFACSDLLSRADGTGRCGAWARFLVAMHEVHGVTSSAVFGVVPIDAPYLIVRNCDFVGPGKLAVPLTHEGDVDCKKKGGIPGQGKDNPQFLFGDHALVRHGTGIYDPSYGVGPIANQRLWEDGGIAGIGDGIVIITYDGDRHYIPQKCSPGFIKFTLGAMDTLATVAAKFGVPSAKDLYDHPYNAALRGLRAKPGDVKPGDLVLIPRAIASKLTVLRIA